MVTVFAKFVRSRVYRVASVVLMLVAADVLAVPSTEVYWAGFAFQGEARSLDMRYPRSRALANAQSTNPTLLDDALREALKDFHSPAFRLEREDLGSVEPDSPSSTAVAFVLDRERVSVEKIAEDYKILVGLSAQALFFDFREMAVIASHPLSFLYIHTTKSRPTETELQKLVDDFYLGRLPVKPFDEFADALAKVDPATVITRRLQVSSVSIDESVRELLPAHWRMNDADFPAFVAEQFNRELVENQRVPVLPYVKDYAIGNRMALKMAEGGVFNLSLPEADYTISLTLERLVKKEYHRAAAGVSYVYGSYLRVKAEEPLRGQVFMDEIVKNGVVKKVPARQVQVDDWAAFEDSLLVLMKRLTRVIDAPTRDWAKRHIGDEDAVNDLARFGRMVLSCK